LPTGLNRNVATHMTNNNISGLDSRVSNSLWQWQERRRRRGAKLWSGRRAMPSLRALVGLYLLTKQQLIGRVVFIQERACVK
jgi:hypothetical protein